MGGTPSLPTFEEEYEPRIKNQLEQNIVNINKKVDDIKHCNNVDAAERDLEMACGAIKQGLQQEVEEIRKDMKRIRNQSNNRQFLEKYRILLASVEAGILVYERLTNDIVERMTSLIQIIIGWIRWGLTWVAEVIMDTFNGIRKLFG